MPLLPGDARLQKEYRDGGTTTDLYLKWQGIIFAPEIFFELKYNFSRPADLQRVIGQIVLLNPKRRNIIVLLCGESDPGLVRQLHEVIVEHFAPDPAFGLYDFGNTETLIFEKKFLEPRDAGAKSTIS